MSRRTTDATHIPTDADRDAMRELLEWRAKRKVERKRLKIRYLPYLPKKGVPEGFVLVHNRVQPQLDYGLNGFRWWRQLPDDALEECPCEWCGFAKEFGAPHYRIKRKIDPLFSG